MQCMVYGTAFSGMHCLDIFMFAASSLDLAACVVPVVRGASSQSHNSVLSGLPLRSDLLTASVSGEGEE